MSQRRIQRALLSTANKTGIVELAKELVACHIALIATGGTAALLAEHHIPHQSVSELTGFPEILDGRVKTLHPAIHAGLLSRRTKADQVILKQQHIDEIDLLIVNLYPFEETISQDNSSLENAIEQIDIGGPTLLRAAAKNFAHVSAVIDPNDYATVIKEIKRTGNTTLETRRYLSAKVFDRVAKYNNAIAQYLMPSDKKTTDRSLHTLRYGENPHQEAQLKITQETGLANAESLQGKPLSYNNYVDANAAHLCVTAFSEPACVIVKHATPCGVAVATHLTDAYQRALACDPQSAFGGIIAFNQTVDAAAAMEIINKQFVEVIIAPDYHPDALAVFSQKKLCRVLKVNINKQPDTQIRSINGGLLMQTPDTKCIKQTDLTVVTKQQPTEAEIRDSLFAWNVVRFVKSNAIVYAKEGATLGIGTGQTSRVFSAKIAALKAQEAGRSLQHAVMASDAFFPFADSIDLAAQYGIRTIIQPGGSKRDPEVIAMADKHNMVMLFTHTRCFLH